MVGDKTTFHAAAEGGGGDENVAGQFFGQSSFASLSVVKEASVVNVKGLIKSEEELKLFAPMGCGFQTGAGTVVNLAKGTSRDSVAVLGLGGVGLAAVMVSLEAGVTFSQEAPLRNGQIGVLTWVMRNRPRK